jgi:hypothetical protein
MPLPARKTHVVSEQDTTKTLPLLFFLTTLHVFCNPPFQIELSTFNKLHSHVLSINYQNQIDCYHRYIDVKRSKTPCA